MLLTEDILVSPVSKTNSQDASTCNLQGYRFSDSQRGKHSSDRRSESHDADDTTDDSLLTIKERQNLTEYFLPSLSHYVYADRQRSTSEHQRET